MPIYPVWAVEAVLLTSWFSPTRTDYVTWSKKKDAPHNSLGWISRMGWLSSWINDKEAEVSLKTTAWEENRKQSNTVGLLFHTQEVLSERFGSKPKGNMVDGDGMRTLPLCWCCSVWKLKSEHRCARLLQRITLTCVCHSDIWNIYIFRAS